MYVNDVFSLGSVLIESRCDYAINIFWH